MRDGFVLVAYKDKNEIHSNYFIFDTSAAHKALGLSDLTYDTSNIWFTPDKVTFGEDGKTLVIDIKNGKYHWNGHVFEALEVLGYDMVDHRNDQHILSFNPKNGQWEAL